MGAFSGRLGLFVSDLDGTLLSDLGAQGCRASERAKAALRGLRERGVVVCLASGRMHESIRAIGAEMGVDGPVISYNGGMVRAADDTVLLSRTLDAEVAAEITALVESRDLPMNYYLDGVLYARRVQPWWDLYQGRTSSPMREVDSLAHLKGGRPHKLLVYASAAEVRALKAEWEPRFAGRCELLITANEYLEFVPLGVDKGPALAALAASLGLGPERVAAAGDGWNDLGMLRWAGLAVAVESGRDEAKACADVIVPGPEHDGLAEFIERRFLAPVGEATHG